MVWGTAGRLPGVGKFGVRLHPATTGLGGVAPMGAHTVS